MCAAALFTAVAAHAQSKLSLAWDANTESNISGYKLYWGVATRMYTNAVDVGNFTTASVSNLAVGVTYRFAVTAYNSSGAESDFSSEISHTITNPGDATNVPPTLTSLGSRTIPEDTSTGRLPFTIGDAETAASLLTLSATSSNPGLVPSANIVFGGSGSNRTVQIIPLTNQFGAAAITVSVSDGFLAASRTLALTVSNVNDPPTIAPLADAVAPVKTKTSLAPVLIADIDTAATNLVVFASSSNTSVLPTGNIFLGTSGLSRTLSVHPLKTGKTTVTMTVSDGLAQSSQSFLLTVTNSHRFKVRPSYISTTGDRGFTVNWESTPGFAYRVMGNYDLTLTNWVNLSGTLVASSETLAWTDRAASTRKACLYIIELLPPD